VEKATDYFPTALKAKGGWTNAKTPIWQFKDKGGSEGPSCVRPAVAKRPGKLLGSWPPQREINIKEHIIKEKPGYINFEVLLLPKLVKEKLWERNRKELEIPTRVF
jgi:hypothetical protein